MCSLPCAYQCDIDSIASCYSQVGVVAYSVGTLIAIEDVESGKIIQVLNGHSTPIVKLAISSLVYDSFMLNGGSPDMCNFDKTLFLASSDQKGICKIWDIKKGTVLYEYKTSASTTPIFMEWMGLSYSKVFDKDIDISSVASIRTLLIMENISAENYKIIAICVDASDPSSPILRTCFEKVISLSIDIKDIFISCKDTVSSGKHIIYFLGKNSVLYSCKLREFLEGDTSNLKPLDLSLDCEIKYICCDKNLDEEKMFIFTENKLIERFAKESEDRFLKIKPGMSLLGTSETLLLLLNKDGDLMLYDMTTFKRKKVFKISDQMASSEGVPLIVSTQFIIYPYNSHKSNVWILTNDGSSCLIDITEIDDTSKSYTFEIRRISHSLPKNITSFSYRPISKYQRERKEHKNSIFSNLVMITQKDKVQLWLTNPLSLVRSFSLNCTPIHTELISNHSGIFSTEQRLYYVNFKTSEIHEFTNEELHHDTRAIKKLVLSPNKNFLLVCGRYDFFILKLHDFSIMNIGVSKNEEINYIASWSIPVVKRGSLVIVCGTYIQEDKPDTDVLVLLNKISGELTYVKLNTESAPEKISGDYENSALNDIECFVAGGPWLVGKSSSGRFIFYNTLAKESINPWEKNTENSSKSVNEGEEDKSSCCGENSTCCQFKKIEEISAELKDSKVSLYLSNQAAAYMKKDRVSEQFDGHINEDDSERSPKSTKYSTTSPLLLLVYVEEKCVVTYLLLDHEVKIGIKESNMDTGERELLERCNNIENTIDIIKRARNKVIDAPNLNILQVGYLEASSFEGFVSSVVLNTDTLSPMIQFGDFQLSQTNCVFEHQNSEMMITREKKSDKYTSDVIEKIGKLARPCIGCLPLMSSRDAVQYLTAESKRLFEEYKKTKKCSLCENFNIYNYLRTDNPIDAFFHINNIHTARDLKDENLLHFVFSILGFWIEDSILSEITDDADTNKRNNNSQPTSLMEKYIFSDDKSVLFSLIDEVSQDEKLTNALLKISISPSFGLDEWASSIRENMGVLVESGHLEHAVFLMVSAGMLEEAIAELQRREMFELSLGLAEAYGGAGLLEEAAGACAAQLRRRGDVVAALRLAAGMCPRRPK